MKMSEFSWKLRVETPDHDFKKELETKKAKSWLKTVSVTKGTGPLGSLYGYIMLPDLHISISGTQ